MIDHSFSSFFFFLIWALRPVKIISLILSSQNEWFPENTHKKKNLTTRKAELGLSLMWQSSNPQQWNDPAITSTIY